MKYNTKPGNNKLGVNRNCIRKKNCGINPESNSTELFSCGLISCKGRRHMLVRL